nr:unnamed protein product [Callosobruchus chinensis]
MKAIHNEYGQLTKNGDKAVYGEELHDNISCSPRHDGEQAHEKFHRETLRLQSCYSYPTFLELGLYGSLVSSIKC